MNEFNMIRVRFEYSWYKTDYINIKIGGDGVETGFWKAVNDHASGSVKLGADGILKRRSDTSIIGDRCGNRSVFSQGIINGIHSSKDIARSEIYL